MDNQTTTNPDLNIVVEYRESKPFTVSIPKGTEKVEIILFHSVYQFEIIKGKLVPTGKTLKS